jgi:hypothetical protein
MEEALGPLPPSCSGRLVLLDPAAADMFMLATRDLPDWPTNWAVSLVGVLGPHTGTGDAWSTPARTLSQLQVVSFMSASHTRAVTWLIEWLAQVAPGISIHRRWSDRRKTGKMHPTRELPPFPERRHRLVYNPWISENGLRLLDDAGWLPHFTVGLLPARFYQVCESLWSLGWPLAGHALLARGQEHDTLGALAQALASFGYQWERVRALGPCSERLAERLAALARTDDQRSTFVSVAARSMATSALSPISVSESNGQGQTSTTEAGTETAIPPWNPEPPVMSAPLATPAMVGNSAQTTVASHPCLEPWQQLGSVHEWAAEPPCEGADLQSPPWLPDEPRENILMATARQGRPQARLVLLDRWLDPITPLVTPVSVEGLELEMEQVPWWQQWDWADLRPAKDVRDWFMEAKWAMSSARTILLTMPAAQRLSETDRAQLEDRLLRIRREPYFQATAQIGIWARALKRFSEQRPDPKTAVMEQVAAYVGELHRHQVEQQLVAALLEHAERLSAITFDLAHFRNLLAMERELLRGETERRMGVERFVQRLESILAAVAVASSQSWLGEPSLFWRLMMLHYLCSGSDDFAERHTGVFQLAACCYGSRCLSNDWQALVQSDLVAQIRRVAHGSRDGASLLMPAPLDWPLVRAALQLDQVEPNIPDVFAGYFPLSAALAILACDGKRSCWRLATSAAQHVSGHVDGGDEDEKDDLRTAIIASGQRAPIVAEGSNHSLLILRQTPNLLRPVQPRHWHHGALRELCQRALRWAHGPSTRMLHAAPIEASMSFSSDTDRADDLPECILLLGGCSPVEAQYIASAVAQSRGTHARVQILTTAVCSSREWLFLTLHGDSMITENHLTEVQRAF